MKFKEIRPLLYDNCLIRLDDRQEFVYGKDAEQYDEYEVIMIRTNYDTYFGLCGVAYIEIVLV